MTITNCFNNSRNIDNKLLEFCEEFRKGNIEKVFTEFSQIPQDAQEKIFKYQWKVLGKPTFETNPSIAHDRFGELAFYNRENRSSNIPQKIEAIEKYLIHQIKNDLISIKSDFEKGDDTTVFSKFSRVCVLSKHIEPIKNLENEIYHIMWKVLKRPEQLRVGEIYFNEPIGDLSRVDLASEEQRHFLCKKYHKKAKAISKYLRHLSNFSFLPSTLKNDELYLNIIKEKRIVIMNGKEFRKQVFEDIQTLLTIDLGRELFSRIENQNKKVMICFSKNSTHARIFPEDVDSKFFSFIPE